MFRVVFCSMTEIRSVLSHWVPTQSDIVQNVTGGTSYKEYEHPE